MKSEITQDWRNRTEVTESIEELKTLINRMSVGRLTWQGFLLCEKESRSLTNAWIAARTGVTRQAFEKWLNRGVLPDSRDAFLKLGMGLGMGLDEINRMLTRYGTYPQLYPKNAHDAICIFVISRYSQGQLDSELYRDYPFRRVETLEGLLCERFESTPLHISGDLPTEQAKEGLLAQDGDSGFLRYLLSRRDVFFSPSNLRLRHYIDDFVRIQETDATSGHNAPTIHALVTEGMLNPAFEKMLSRLHSQDEVPRRERLIAMGINFNMTVEMLDQMLRLARMEPLCARDPVEMALIYAVRSAHLFDPTMEYEIASRLSHFARDKENVTLSRTILAFHERAYSDRFPEAPDFGTQPEYVRHVLVHAGLSREAKILLDALSPAAQP